MPLFDRLRKIDILNKIKKEAEEEEIIYEKK